MRIYSGKLDAGSYIYNPSTDTKERVGRILQMHSNTREELKSAQAGDIVAVIGLKKQEQETHFVQKEMNSSRKH